MREQRATHGLAWLATYVEAIRQLGAYAQRLDEGGTLGEIEEFLVHIALGEYLAQIQGGIPMSQGEIVRPADMGLTAPAIAARMAGPLETLVLGNAERRARLVTLMRHHGLATVGDYGLDDTLGPIREEMNKFAANAVVPHANEWHWLNDYIPLAIIAQMAELGVFGLTIPEAHGGMGLGKEAMCVVSEELSRGYIGVGSLGTRTEIAAELILIERHRGAEAPLAAETRIRRSAADRSLHRAECRLRPRRDRDARGTPWRRLQCPWRQDLHHPRRARRPDGAARAHQSRRTTGHRGLSMLLAEKPRGTDEEPFPAPGMTAPRSGCSAIAA